MMARTTADIVKAIREQQGWSQEETGKIIGVGRSQICNVETGRHDLPSSKLLALLDAANWGIVSY
jgi:transcriptional regulator with XRE-family HTH domain